jgi:Tfp pilus assembly protein PilF
MPPARVALGNAWLETGRPADAIPEFEAALEADPVSVYALTNLGFAHARAGRQVDAIAYYEKALALAPDFAPAHRNLGAVLMAQREDRRGDRALRAGRRRRSETTPSPRARSAPCSHGRVGRTRV